MIDCGEEKRRENGSLLSLELWGGGGGGKCTKKEREKGGSGILMIEKMGFIKKGKRVQKWV